MFRMNKFYVGARHIAESIEVEDNHEWTKATVEEAVEHARETMEEDNLDMAIVVQIIRVLKRKSNPIVVEKVK